MKRVIRTSICIVAFGIVRLLARARQSNAQHFMCPSLYDLETHNGEPSHGNVCRSIIKTDYNFVCPRCCTTVAGPPFCVEKNTQSPCRSASLEACTSNLNAHGHHNNRAPIKKTGPKTMHTFFETVPSWSKSEQAANVHLLRTWKKIWNTAGWKTSILSLADAQAHPDFKKLENIINTVPLGTNKIYDKMCYIRHLAMAQAGGGWMADFDTIPLNLKPGIPLPNNGRWTSQEWGVPSLVSGNKTEWLRMAFMIAITASKHKNEKLFSDMMAMQELANQKPPPYVLKQNVLGLSRTFGSELWGPNPCKSAKHKWVAHLSHFAFGTANKKQLDRADVIVDTFDKWRNKCIHGHDARLYATDKSMQISRTNRLIFVHVPKTAGSLVERSQLFADARKYHAIGGHYSVTEMKADLAFRKLDGFTTFAFVRHPCERYISAYTYLKTGLGNAGDAEWTRENIGDYDVNEFAHQLGPLQKKSKLAKHFELQTSQLFYPNGTVGIDVLLVHQPNISKAMSPLASVRPDLAPLLPNATSKRVLGSNHGKCASLTASARRALTQFYAFDYCVLFKDATTPARDLNLTARWARCTLR